MGEHHHLWILDIGEFMNHEVWRLVAAGLLDSLLADLIAVTSRDARARLWAHRMFLGKFGLDAHTSLGYVPEIASLTMCRDMIVNAVYNPSIEEGWPKRPVNAASDGTTLSCDDPTEGETVMVYQWANYATFDLLGPLAENSQPVAGIYVLVLHIESSVELIGLPSLNLTIV
jgi:hypothetical protein